MLVIVQCIHGRWQRMVRHQFLLQTRGPRLHSRLFLAHHVKQRLHMVNRRPRRVVNRMQVLSVRSAKPLANGCAQVRRL